MQGKERNGEKREKGKQKNKNGDITVYIWARKKVIKRRRTAWEGKMWTWDINWRHRKGKKRKGKQEG